MAQVALIERKTSDIIKVVETDRIQFTIDALMRNRDPRQFVAHEIQIKQSD